MQAIHANRQCKLLAASIALSLGFARVSHAQALLVRGARLIDGTGSPPREDVSLLLRAGRIAAIGHDLQVPGVPELNAEGATVLPGLIDVHAHLGWGPGAAVRDSDRPEVWGSLHHAHLRAYLACGVTTVLDPAAPVEAVREIRSLLAAGHPGPRYLTTGPLLMPPGGYPLGYPEGWWIPLGTVDDVEQSLDRLAALGAEGVKVTLERGWNPIDRLPLLSPELRKAIREGSGRRGLPVYVHATAEDDQAAALDMGTRALMHPIIYRRRDLSPDFVRRMAESGAYQVTTLAMLATPMMRFRPESLDDPLLALVVPEDELATARDPDAVTASFAAQAAANAPWWFPGSLSRWAMRIFFSEEREGGALRRSQRALLALHRAGVPLVIGSDSAFNPWATHSFHGASTLLEIELLGATGLEPAEVLAAATRNAAEMLGLAAEIGTVEVGKRADLVIVRGDPLRDLGALRRIAWTVRDGVAHTPEEWMENAAGAPLESLRSRRP